MDGGKAPIGIFDSGIGGLTVLKAIRSALPNENILYLADQAHVPYGSRNIEEIRKYSKGIANYLVNRGAKTIVVACNTASAAALYSLREQFSKIPFVGMEPAIKPAAETTETGVVGVLATPTTFQGALYASIVERFASDVQLLQDPCIGLVQEIDAGNLDGNETRIILEKALKPMIEANIDTVVLGCTHFPFVFPLIEQIVGPSVRLINPAPAIAQQVIKVLGSNLNRENKNIGGKTSYLTTGGLKTYRQILNKLGYEGKVKRITWGDDIRFP